MSSNIRRIRRPADKESLFEELVISENRIFNTYKDLFIFAACLGFIHKKRISFTKSLEPIPWSVFSSDIKNETIFNLIILSENEDINLLSLEKFDDKATIVEEYANGGFQIIIDKVFNKTGDKLENILNLIFEYEESKNKDNDSDIPNLADLDIF